MKLFQTLSTPIGRVFIATIFFMSGINKIFGYAGTQGYMEAMGISGELLPLVIIVEVLAGLAVIIGWKTRLAAFILAAFSIVTAVLFHANFADQIQFIMFMKNLAIAGGLLFLVANGPDAYALDNRLKTE